MPDWCLCCVAKVFPSFMASMALICDQIFGFKLLWHLEIVSYPPQLKAIESSAFEHRINILIQLY